MNDIFPVTLEDRAMGHIQAALLDLHEGYVAEARTGLNTALALLQNRPDTCGRVEFGRLAGLSVTAAGQPQRKRKSTARQKGGGA